MSNSGALTVDIAERGTLVMTRPGGERIRRWLERLIADRPERDTIRLDFRSVQGFDHPSADEAFAKLLLGLRSGAEPPRCVVFLNPSAAQTEHLDAVLARRDLFALASDRRGFHLIGHVPAGVSAVFEYVVLHGEARAVHLGQEFGITTNAASNRLRLLWLAGILQRHESFDRRGGRAYVYELPHAALEGTPRRGASGNRRRQPSSPTTPACHRSRG